ncbi:MAG: hypothetical protein K1X68_05270 [Saprospiraceae bacterium]|nr:hypothetical protein [Saprospiraceae bacterium]HMW40259.1 hypothetical protein [Saprospiraceae bacterium]HMX89341.1 hypothetical protein [Saprospiraceae bacterium]HMZ40452.1 hypothetical protein [Saprospiraceae bacterium]HNA64032.1 hypothetical protein [Saprospiraceae bacterium]
MKINYILSTIKSFQKREARLFLSFLGSEFNNTNANFIPFYNHLLQKIQQEVPGSFEPEELSKALSPDKPLSPVQLRQRIAQFKKTLNSFLISQNFKKNQSLQNSILLNTLRHKNLQSNFRKTLRNISSNQSIPAKESIVDPIFEKYILHKEIYEFEHSISRFTGDQITPLVQTLDEYFILENIKLACYDWVNFKESGNRAFFKSRINLAINQFLGEARGRNQVLDLYINIFRLIYEQPESDFESLLNTFYSNEEFINDHDRKYLYIILINYCAFFYNSGDQKYASLALMLYIRGLENRILLEANRLSPYTYKNIIFLYLNLYEYEQARQFMDKYTSFLPADIRNNSYQFNLATLLFRQGDYDRALEIMSNTRFIDVYDDLNSRRMLLRIYYERREWMALNSLLDSFEIFLKRKKNIGSHRELFTTLIKFTRKILTLNKSDRTKIKNLIREISQTPPFPEKSWLEGKLAALYS